jgi:hypothetical protein
METEYGRGKTKKIDRIEATNAPTTAVMVARSVYAL